MGNKSKYWAILPLSETTLSRFTIPTSQIKLFSNYKIGPGFIRARFALRNNNTGKIRFVSVIGTGVAGGATVGFNIDPFARWINFQTKNEHTFEDFDGTVRLGSIFGGGGSIAFIAWNGIDLGRSFWSGGDNIDLGGLQTNITCPICIGIGYYPGSVSQVGTININMKGTADSKELPNSDHIQQWMEELNKIESVDKVDSILDTYDIPRQGCSFLNTEDVSDADRNNTSKDELSSLNIQGDTNSQNNAQFTKSNDEPNILDLLSINQSNSSGDICINQNDSNVQGKTANQQDNPDNHVTDNQQDNSAQFTKSIDEPNVFDLLTSNQSTSSDSVCLNENDSNTKVTKDNFDENQQDESDNQEENNNTIDENNTNAKMNEADYFKFEPQPTCAAEDSPDDSAIAPDTGK